MGSHERATLRPRRRMTPDLATAPPAAPAAAPAAHPAGPARPARLLSLDVFRGATIAGMLLVNNPGDWSNVYAPLLHAPWHGWTPTDLIFPFFLFIVGVSMAYSFAAQRERGEARASILARASKRAAMLFALGLVLHAYPWWSADLSTLRIPGVLQRIALVFLLATPLVLWGGARAWAGATAVLLVGYWAAMRWVPVPGIGAGVWEPGRDLGSYVDRAVFGTAHLWRQAQTWDPEGLLSTLPALATALIGVQAGAWIRRGGDPRGMLLGLMLAGGALMVLGSVWAWAFPINKNLWTSSYVLLTGGIALQALAACYWVADVRGHRRWAWPFLVFGTNAIAAFFLSSLAARMLITHRVAGPAGEAVTLKSALYQPLFASWLPPTQASLAFALAYTAFWLGAMALLYHRRIFLKV
jgi:predicted acyltransferase